MFKAKILCFLKRIFLGIAFLLLLSQGFAQAKDSPETKPGKEDLDRSLSSKKDLFKSKLPISEPVQITSEVDRVHSFALSPDGKRIVYSLDQGTNKKLFLSSARAGEIILPKKIVDLEGEQHSPAYSPDGKRIAFVSTKNDVKGDIYVQDLESPNSPPVRLTGSRTADGEPCFSADGNTLYFQVLRPGKRQADLAWIDLSGALKEPKIEILVSGGMQPRISPDGKKLAYVSQAQDLSGDILVLDLKNKEKTRLTSGSDRDRQPSWSEDGSQIFFSRIRLEDSDRSSFFKRKSIYVIKLEKKKGSRAYPLTAGEFAAGTPVSSKKRLFFLSKLGGVFNVWSLPVQGQVPDLSQAKEQMDLARRLDNLVPPRELLAALGYSKVIENFAGHKKLLVQAGLEMGRIYQGLEALLLARSAYKQALELLPSKDGIYFDLKIPIVKTEAEIAWQSEESEELRQKVLKDFLSKLETLASSTKLSQRQAAEAVLAQADLLLKFALGSKDLTRILDLLDKLDQFKELGPEQRARAKLLRGGVYSSLGREDLVRSYYLQALKQGVQGGEARREAVQRILDLSVSVLDEDQLEERIQTLIKVAEQSRKGHPALAMAAWNRIGDIWYKADKWSQAKSAYREVLEGFEQKNRYTAAARFALAEILYQEERFYQALELYSEQMSASGYLDRVYNLARQGYIQKSLSAASYHFRLKEVSIAESIYARLREYDPFIVRAHRGYIKCAQAQGRLLEVLKEYHDLRNKDPKNPILIYSLGLAKTYKEDKASLLAAKKLILEAISLKANLQYFYQTLGYVCEALENVYAQKQGLEKALDAYKKAYFLNRVEVDPRNRAALELNLGNVYFALGQYSQAYEFYLRRENSGIEFENPDTELIFYRRFGQAAFQAEENENSVEAFLKSLDLVQEKLRPKQAGVYLGKLQGYLRDRILLPARESGKEKESKALAEEQSGLNQKSYSLNKDQVLSPPDPSWEKYKQKMDKLLQEQKSLLPEYRELVQVLPELGWTEAKRRLEYLLKEAEKALDYPLNFRNLEAELYDRLGLSYMESGSWEKAGEYFSQAFELNKELKNLKNLAPNSRSRAFCLYQEAKGASGENRVQILEKSKALFEKILEYIDKYGLAKKKKKMEKEALVEIELEVSLDKGKASQAYQGFDKEQEIRLAQAFISRIETELGHYGQADRFLEEQLKEYQGVKIAEEDRFGLALLKHRAGHVKKITGKDRQAFDYFLGSAVEALEMGNPVQAGVNLANAALILARGEFSSKALRDRIFSLRKADLEVRRIFARDQGLLRPEIAAGYYNQMGAAYTVLAALVPSKDLPGICLQTLCFQEAGVCLSKGILRFESLKNPLSRDQHCLLTSLYLNRARLKDLLGQPEEADKDWSRALDRSEKGLLADLKWRALLGLDKYSQALEELQNLSLLELGSARQEIMKGFAPYLRLQFENKNWEKTFNLAEVLAELERVNRMAPFLISKLSSKELQSLKEIYPRVLKIRELRQKASGNKEGLGHRLEQEKKILKQRLEKEKSLQGFLSQFFPKQETRKWFLILAGISGQMQDLAKGAVQGSDKEERKAKKQKYQELRKRYLRLREEARLELSGSYGLGLLELVLSSPVQGVEFVQSLPEEAVCVYFLPSSRQKQGLELLQVSAQGIHGKRVGQINKLKIESSLKKQVLVSSSFLELKNFALDFDSFALSATHLYRCLKNKSPFKERVLKIPPGGLALPEKGFSQVQGQSKDQFRLRDFILQAQTLILDSGLYLSQSVPTRENELPRPLLRMDLSQDKWQEATSLFADLKNVSLTWTRQARIQDAYFLGHFFALAGVPSLILGSKQTEQDLEKFFQNYLEKPVYKSLPSLDPGKETTPVFLFGHWGMDKEQAREYSIKRFNLYVRKGMQEFKQGSYAMAWQSFAQALQVAEEEKNLPKRADYLVNLYKYSRESAFLAGNLDKAGEYARKLVKHLENENKDGLALAQALLKLGLIQSRLEEYEAAVGHMGRGVEILDSLNLPQEKAKALGDLGAVLENASFYEQALQKYRQAAQLGQSMQSKEMVAAQYADLARIYDLRLSRYALAMDYYNKAKQIYQGLGKRKQYIQILIDLARCVRLLGDFSSAKKRLKEVEDLLKKDKGRLWCRLTLEKAHIAWFQGRYQEAFSLQHKAYNQAKAHGWALEQVISLNTSGLTWWTLGNSKRALRELNQALSQAKTLQIREDEVATSLNNLGIVYRDMGRLNKAEEYLEKALSIDKQQGSKWALSYDLRNLGLVSLKQGRIKEALDRLGQALELAQEIGNKVNQAKSLLALGSTSLKEDSLEKARDYFAQAKGIADKIYLREVKWRSRFGLSKYYLKQGQEEKAEKVLLEALEIIEEMRGELKINQLKDSFIADKMQVYSALVSLYADKGRQKEAFYTAERSRARNLIDLLANQDLTLGGKIEKDLYQRLKRVQQKLRAQEQLVAQAESEEGLEVYRERLRELKDQHQDLMLEIQSKRPELASLVSVKPLRAEGIQGLLEPGTGLLNFYLLEDRILSWLITKQGLEFKMTPLGRPALKEEVLAYRRILQNLEPFEQASKELYTWLIKPWEDEIRDLKMLGIVPHGVLHYLSFATLYDGEDYFLDQAGFFYLPSSSVLKYTLSRKTGKKNRKVLAIGNPDLKKPGMELPFAEREIDSIHWRFPNTDELIGAKATESWVVEHIDEYGIIHLASHGEFNPVNPLFSAIMLTEDLERDGELEALEVFGLSINADLVVLSACQTGLGKVSKGDEVIGLNRAFLYAGTQAIISSLWRVSDVSTALCMKQFYREYAEKGKARSLKEAMQHTRNFYPHPGYWGAFTLVGEY